MLSFVTPSNDEPFSLHNLRTSLPTPFAKTGHWLHMDKPEEFNRILDGFPSANFLERRGYEVRLSPGPMGGCSLGS
jgi:hypothetical protein